MDSHISSFCPALAALAKAMRMSENLAGVTLLAFGNGSPDIFTALADFEGDTELLYSELFGRFRLYIKFSFCKCVNTKYIFYIRFRRSGCLH